MDQLFSELPVISSVCGSCFDQEGFSPTFRANCLLALNLVELNMLPSLRFLVNNECSHFIVYIYIYMSQKYISGITKLRANKRSFEKTDNFQNLLMNQNPNLNLIFNTLRKMYMLPIRKMNFNVFSLFHGVDHTSPHVPAYRWNKFIMNMSKV